MKIILQCPRCKSTEFTINEKDQYFQCGCGLRFDRKDMQWSSDSFYIPGNPADSNLNL